MGAANKVGSWVSYGLGGITGANDAADAAKHAGKVQAQSGREAIAFQRETRDLARGDLQPFTKFGADTLGSLSQMLTPEGQYAYLRDNPMFQAALENVNKNARNTLGFSGLRGDMQGAIFDNYLATGQQYLQPQINNLFNAANIGQSSAAGQANTALSTGQNISNTMTDIGNARAAGAIGAANAYTNQFNQLAQIGGSLGGAAIMCDRRMKVNIHHVGMVGQYNAYLFQYRGGDGSWCIGPMADEVAEVNPGAVITVNGMKLVDMRLL